MKKILFCLLFFIIGLSGVKAAEWILIYEDENLSVSMYDDIKETDDGYLVWTHWELNEPRTEGNLKFYSMKDYSEYNKYFDKSRSYSTVYYDAAGKVITSYDPAYQKWEYLVPGSVGYAIAESIYEWVK